MLDHLVACVVGDPKEANVRGCVVLHQDPRLLPRDPARNTPGASDAPFLAVRLDSTDSQIFSYVMDGQGPSGLVVDHVGAHSLDEAQKVAAEWCGEGARPVPFHNMPGVYQAAFLSLVTGREPELGELLLLWVQPDEAGGYALVRDYPPGLLPDKRFDGNFMALHVAAVRQLQIKYGLR